MTRPHAVEVGEEHVLGILRAAVEFIDDFDRPRAEHGRIGKRASPFTGDVKSDFPAVHVLDGGWVTGERACDQIDQTRLADAGSD